MTPAAQRRVALIPSAYHPETGGVEEHTRQVARALVACGHAVEIWTVRRDRSQPARDVVDGIPVRRLPCPLPAMRMGNILRFLLELPMARRAWLEALREFRPDVLHVHCFGPNGLYAQWLGRRACLPIVLSAHGETVADDHSAFAESALLRFALRSALRQADAVTGCSAFTLADLRARFGLPPNRGDVVFNGVGPAPEREDAGWEPPAHRYVLALGRAVSNKGYDLLIRAYAQMAHETEADLVIGGGGPALASLRDLAGSLGVGARVHLVGRLDSSQVADAMGGAAVFALTSRVESFGIVLLEAWRAGLPLIATTRGGPREFVRDGVDGLLVDPLDIGALAVALHRLLSDAPRARAMGEAGRARLGDFGWDRTAAAYLHIYDAVLRTRTTSVASSLRHSTMRGISSAAKRAPAAHHVRSGSPRIHDFGP